MDRMLGRKVAHYQWEPKVDPSYLKCGKKRFRAIEKAAERAEIESAFDDIHDDIREHELKELEYDIVNNLWPGPIPKRYMTEHGEF